MCHRLPPLVLQVSAVARRHRPALSTETATGTLKPGRDQRERVSSGKAGGSRSQPGSICGVVWLIASLLL